MTWIVQEKLTQVKNLMLKIAEYGKLLFLHKTVLMLANPPWHC